MTPASEPRNHSQKHFEQDIMRTIGLIGGISWVSTADYYKFINQGVNEALGGLNFSQCLIHSFNYADIKKNNDANDWESTFQLLDQACHALKTSGAEGIVLCANTMHLIAERLENSVGLPLIHIATATATAVRKSHLKRVGLLGTRFTMELDFFRARLLDQGISTLIPEEEEREFIHYTIFEELGRGLVREQTKEKYLTIIDNLVSKGAEGIILGCTEIPLLIQQADVSVPVFDTTRIHAKAAVDFQLGKS